MDTRILDHQGVQSHLTLPGIPPLCRLHQHYLLSKASLRTTAQHTADRVPTISRPLLSTPLGSHMLTTLPSIPPLYQQHLHHLHSQSHLKNRVRVMSHIMMLTPHTRDIHKPRHALIAHLLHPLDKPKRRKSCCLSMETVFAAFRPY